MSVQPHDHSHAHAHDYHHDEEDSYYLDQLCMIGLCGAFAAICLGLWFWQTGMLNLMLGSQFHPFVLGSGIALLLIAGVRAVVLWVQVGQESHAHGHHHHGHDHDHQHANDDHPHDHPHHADHHHDHDHHHHHDHEHDHGHTDHDHGWAPWRYVVLLVPVILFLLGLPNRLPDVPAMDVDLFRDTSNESMQAAALLGLGPDGYRQMTLLAGLMEKNHPLVIPVDPNKAQTLEFGTLWAIAQTAESRKKWEGELVQALGQFSPSKSNAKVFTLVRHRMQCCAADRIAIPVPVFANESIDHVKAGAWVRVIGRVSFARSRGGNEYVTLLSVPGKAAVLPSPPDPSPYIR